MLTFRTGSVKDIDAILALFDANIEWLVERGRSEQWGSEPWTGDEHKVNFVRALLSDGEITMVEIEGEIVVASLRLTIPCITYRRSKSWSGTSNSSLLRPRRADRLGHPPQYRLG